MAGYSAQHVRLRPVVLERDGHRCQRPRLGDEVCGRPATHAGHIIDRALGGTDTLDNLRAECERCNCTAGGELRQTIAAGDAVSHPVFSRGPLVAAQLSAISLPRNQ